MAQDGAVTPRGDGARRPVQRRNGRVRRERGRGRRGAHRGGNAGVPRVSREPGPALAPRVLDDGEKPQPDAGRRVSATEFTLAVQEEDPAVRRGARVKGRAGRPQGDGAGEQIAPDRRRNHPRGVQAHARQDQAHHARYRPRVRRRRRGESNRSGRKGLHRFRLKGGATREGHPRGRRQRRRRRDGRRVVA